jgi:N-acetyl-gamma-glutamyl-phosphate reductase
MRPSFFIGSMMKVAVVGATGYTGLELVRILSQHPRIRLAALTSESYSGKAFDAVYPAQHAICSMTLEPLDPEKLTRKADLIFTALPHQEAMAVVPLFLRAGKRVIDLSADFRFASQKTYERWYQKHAAPELLREAVYGLSEINRGRIRSARLVANPGCYPTSIILPLAPLLKEGVIATTGIIADSKSGVSGAGRSLKTTSLFCEVSEGFRPYSLMQHRHQPEIEEQLTQAAGKRISITFSPHLLPINRGILSTIYTTLKKAVSPRAVRSLLESFYKKEKFVRILPDGLLPSTGQVRGSNYCDIGLCADGRRLILVAALDNLVKGASGQAVQNMNIMLGCDEHLGLKHIPLYP